MKRFRAIPFFLVLVFFAFAGKLTSAMENSAGQQPSLATRLAQKKYNRRIVLLFARDEHQPDLIDQQEQFADYTAALKERDMDVMVVVASALTESDGRFLTAAPFKLNPVSAFQGWLIGKDGGVKDRFSQPIAPPSLFREVDSMPMRRQEMKRQ